MTPREKYISDYYRKEYGGGTLGKEIKLVGSFLLKNTYGRILDCGCGPTPHLWGIFMPRVKEIYAVDLAPESIDFVRKKIKEFNSWKNDFSSYRNFVKKEVGSLPRDYIKRQIGKIKYLKQADMTKNLPFENSFFDVALSLYSLGVLRNEKELKMAVKNISRILRAGGKFLHINTNGYNFNDILPEYTWRGLNQNVAIIEKYLRLFGFEKIKSEEIKLNYKRSGMYKYSSVFLLSAIKKI